MLLTGNDRSMKKSAKENRRKEKRVPHKEYVFINGVLRAKAIDISEGGIYVHTGRSFKERTEVYVTFILKYVEIEAKAVVRYSDDGVGMGLMFRDLSKEHLDLVRQYIKDTAPEEEGRGRKKKRLLIMYDRAPLKMHKSELVLRGFTVFELEHHSAVFSRMLPLLPLDLIVLALEMSWQDDFKMLARLMESADFNHIPVVVVSGNCQYKVAHKVMAYGARQFLPRMVTSPKKLASAISVLLEKK